MIARFKAFMIETTYLPLTAVISASVDQVSCDLHGEAAILNLKNGKYYTLNAVGARIWDLLKHPISVGSIYNSIIEEYSVDPQQAAADIQRLIKDLSENNLLVIGNSAR